MIMGVGAETKTLATGIQHKTSKDYRIYFKVFKKTLPGITLFPLRKPLLADAIFFRIAGYQREHRTS